MPFLLSLLSGSLMLLPVGVTLGVYAGLQTQQIIDMFHGKIPPHAGTEIGPNGEPIPIPIITTTTYCEHEVGIEAFPYRYVYNPDVWGDPDNTGALCMNVTSDTGTDPKSFYAANFTATWTYPQRQTLPVHAFPNALLNSTALPVQYSAIQSLVLDVQWSYATGDDAVAAADTDETTLAANSLTCNVALDMFLDDDPTNAANSTAAAFEVMVWVGRFGAAAQPIGYSATPVLTATINNTGFDLFWGLNTATNQKVFTWLAQGNQTTFAGDIAPLIVGLTQVPEAPGPAANAYLGYAAFGSETFYSVGNMTFSVPRLAIEINNS